MDAFVGSWAWTRLAAVLATLSSPILAGNVLVVDASGGGSYTDIQSAINASFDGDTILVKSGSYAGFTIHNTSVSVITDTGAIVHVADTVEVRNLAADRDVLLAGLTIEWIYEPGGNLYVPAVSFRQNLGSVRVERCVVPPHDCSLMGPCEYGHAVRVENCPDVVFVGCNLTGGSGGGAGSGVYAISSSAAFYDCRMEGGSVTQSPGSFCPGEEGGNGAIFFISPLVFSSGSSFQGGDGGAGGFGGLGCSCGSDGGSGGDGIRVHSTTTSLYVLDNTYGGGNGGPASGSQTCFPPTFDGGPGEGVDSASTTYLDGRARHLAIKNPRRERTPFRIEARGRPGDSVILYSSESTGFTYMPSRRGVLIPQNPTPPIQLGTIPASGVLVYHHTVPDLGPGVQSKSIYFQALHTTPAGVKFLGSPVSLVVLDQAF